jgi:universal stress protein A
MSIYRKIICPVDFSRLCGRALEHAAELAVQLDAELSVVHVHVLSVVSLSMGEIAPNPETMVRQSSDLQTKLTRALKEIQRPGLKADTHLLMAESSIAETILHRAADEGADLIVVGGHGRSQVEEFFIGSVANELVRKATCPVLVVPEEDAG